LAGGILTGKYGYEEIPSNSRWGHWQKSRGLPSYWTQDNFSKLEKLKQFSKELNISLAGLCLAWVSAHVDTTLVGPKSEAQMAVVKEAQSFKMNTRVLDKISELIIK
jgi:aryl-alcohol dehydrogenase-like predicted oxidoreductase